ncbi:MAG: alpha/beta hydrolase [Planctomycetota bacterium]|jgi:pimeloyl-ACP methyl ester carboxylesterase
MNCAKLSLQISLALLSTLVACASPKTATIDSGMIDRVHRIKADGHELALREKRVGEPRASILLIHGRTWSGAPDFDLQVPGEELSLMDSLAREGLATYALDLRGYGGSLRDHSGFATPERSAQDVAAALQWIRDRSGVRGKPILFGWSLGAMVSQLTAQEHPELISELVLYGYPHDLGQPIPMEANQERVPDYETNTANAARSDFIIEGAISKHAIDSYVDASLDADPVKADWRQMDQFNALDPSKLAMPTLVIRGQHDPVGTMNRQSKLFKGLANPQSQAIVVAGGGHAVHLESPERFTAALMGFLERPRQTHWREAK